MHSVRRFEQLVHGLGLQQITCFPARYNGNNNKLATSYDFSKFIVFLRCVVLLSVQLGDSVAAEALLDTALAQMQRQQQANPRDSAAADGVGWCLQRLVALKLSLGKATQATKLFQQLSKLGVQGPAGAQVLAKLARAAAAAGDSDAVRTLQQEVPATAVAGSSSVDLDALEDFRRAVSTARRKEEAQKKREAEEASEEVQPKTKKAKKKRKPKYPAGYDPDKPNGGLPLPDPERWLPKWQRSDYKKKQRRRRDRQQETVKGSQGAGRVDEALDRTKAATADGEGPSSDKSKAAAAKPQLPARGGKGKGRR